MGNLVLYIGGFELPDRNAAAQRVIGVAKSLRQLGYEVAFLNAIKTDNNQQEERREYFGFPCVEYSREAEFDYLFRGETAISYIQRLHPQIVIAYNYPAFALNRICSYCRRVGIKCISDVTEWYEPNGNLLHKVIKYIDVEFRMKSVLFKMDGIIAISRFLYDFYENRVPTVLIPPTIDCSDEKWQVTADKDAGITSFVYAGSPSARKEKLDIIVDAIQEIAKHHSVILNVVGITEQQFAEMYNRQKTNYNGVRFHGRVDHKKVIELVVNADWAVIIRENTRMVKAGFPTKLVESISCGTPVIVNSFSNICDYLDDSNSLIASEASIEDTILEACEIRLTPRKDQFDYRRYLEDFVPLFPQITEG